MSLLRKQTAWTNPWHRLPNTRDSENMSLISYLNDTSPPTKFACSDISDARPLKHPHNIWIVCFHWSQKKEDEYNMLLLLMEESYITRDIMSIHHFCGIKILQLIEVVWWHWISLGLSLCRLIDYIFLDSVSQIIAVSKLQRLLRWSDYEQDFEGWCCRCRQLLSHLFTYRIY